MLCAGGFELCSHENDKCLKSDCRGAHAHARKHAHTHSLTQTHTKPQCSLSATHTVMQIISLEEKHLKNNIQF